MRARKGQLRPRREWVELTPSIYPGFTPQSQLPASGASHSHAIEFHHISSLAVLRQSCVRSKHLSGSEKAKSTFEGLEGSSETEFVVDFNSADLEEWSIGSRGSLWLFCAVL